jgi:hypothetical protein
VDAALAELHRYIAELRHIGPLVEELEVPLEYRAVVFLLHRRQLDLDDRLLLRRCSRIWDYGVIMASSSRQKKKGHQRPG